MSDYYVAAGNGGRLKVELRRNDATFNDSASFQFPDYRGNCLYFEVTLTAWLEHGCSSGG